MTVGELLALYLHHHLAGKISAPYYDRLIRQVFPPLAAFELDALPKLVLLGSRPGEVRTMKPEQLFLDRTLAVWVKPTSKNGRPHVVPLPDQLVPLLRLLIRANPPEAQWLFWGETPDVVWCRTSAQKLWEGLRAKAGLSHLWLNDLRRSTASDLLNQGESLGIVQGALNHRSLSQTAKYAYLAVTPLAHALQERADTIVKAI